jgi:hypothetical protein
MRYIEVVSVLLPAMNPATGELLLKPFTTHDWLREQVWPMPPWHDDELMMAIYFRLQPKFKEAAAQHMAQSSVPPPWRFFVPVEDKDYEKFCPLATKKGEKLGAVEEIMLVLRPILMAPSELPAGGTLIGYDKPENTAAGS